MMDRATNIWLHGRGLAPQIAVNMARKGGFWRGDAVNTKARSAPQGSRVIEAEFKGAACARITLPTTRRAM